MTPIEEYLELTQEGLSLDEQQEQLRERLIDVITEIIMEYDLGSYLMEHSRAIVKTGSKHYLVTAESIGPGITVTELPYFEEE